MTLAHRADPIARAKPIVEVLAVEVGKWVEKADVKRLKPMSRVRWVGHEEDLVSIAEFDEVHIEVTAVTIQEEQAIVSPISSLLPGVTIEDLRQPLIPNLVICPAIL